MKNNIQKVVQVHLKDHRSIYTFTVVLMIMGVIFGALIVNSLALSEKQDLITYLQQFFGEMSGGQFSSADDMLRQSFSHNLKYIGVMWILGLSVIGLPIVLILLFLKGVVVGFTVGFLVNQMGWHGLFVALMSVLPQNIILLPAFVVISTASISFSLKMIRQMLVKNAATPILPQFTRYFMLVIGISAVLFIVSLFEAYVSPVLMKTIAG